ncbi:MAG: glycoside hydrolase family 3 N-terminal domain-containing protein [Propionicimonas sp.]|nr:glycoside hydrolase family 3 N-terminal domain-containing protein [Propionicimonas sp.]
MTTTLLHLNPRLSADERASLLLAEMTLREKCFQITSIPPWGYVSADGARAPGADENVLRAPGFINNFGVDDPASMATTVAALQRVAVGETRLGVPLLIQAEALSGFLSGGHMVFPTPVGLAATFSPDLVEAMTDVIRRQMRRVGVRHALSPNLDLGLDPRWGRVHETFGEDPYLAAAMGVAFIRGLQSDDLANGIIATGKHFIGYGSPEGGINLSAVEVGPRRLRDLYAFPFEAAIHLAGLASVMNSYSDVDGIPAALSRAVLTDLLRTTLGFTGFVSADYGAIEQSFSRQKAARTPGEAGRLALHAGLDTEFPAPFGFGDTLVTEVEAGRIDGSEVDLAVHRVLAAKFRLGLFENPYPAESIDIAAIADEGAETSRELAHRSVVLLENDGLLPLSPGLSIAVIGPHAANLVNQFATYSYPAFRDMMVHMSSGGMGNMIGIDPAMVEWTSEVFTSGSGEDYVRDRLGTRSLAEVIAERAAGVTVEPGCARTSDLGADHLERAVAAAKTADVVVLALGGASLWFNGERTEGEGSDSADISLPASQCRLAEAVAATGTPLAVVLTQGRAYTLPPAVRSANALLVTTYAGPFGTKATADVLFGDVNPSGKLPYSVPRSPGQVPFYHHQRNGTGFRNPLPPDVPQHYLDAEATPLYGFGRGDSYTQFDLTDLTCGASMDTGGSTQISATLCNTGGRHGATVVQLYASAQGVGVTRPSQQLAGFARVELEAGSTARIEFELRAGQFGYTAVGGDFVVDPGTLRVWLAFDSEHPVLAADIEVVGNRRSLSSADRTFACWPTVTHRHG